MIFSRDADRGGKATGSPCLIPYSFAISARSASCFFSISALRKPGRKLMPTTPPFLASALSMSSVRLRWMIGQRPAAGVGSDDRRPAEADDVPERLVVGVGDVDDHPQPVHLPDDLSPNSVRPPNVGAGSPEASAQSVCVQWVSVISRTPAR